MFSPEVYDNRMRPKGKPSKVKKALPHVHKCTEIHLVCCVLLIFWLFQVASNSTDDFGAPTVVTGSLFMRSFEKIDDVKMEFSVQITFRQQWYDNRLEYDDMGGKIKYLTMTDSSKVWMPDTFFRNEKQGKFHNIIQPNLYVRIYPNGDVLYSIRVSIKYRYREYRART